MVAVQTLISFSAWGERVLAHSVYFSERKERISNWDLRESNFLSLSGELGSRRVLTSFRKLRSREYLLGCDNTKVFRKK